MEAADQENLKNQLASLRNSGPTCLVAERTAGTKAAAAVKVGAEQAHCCVKVMHWSGSRERHRLATDFKHHNSKLHADPDGHRVLRT